eukprot:m.5968 g.5968  ORF g.5968 m.5968 type:complete len:94 (+) comp4821_c0_seq1:111-392(+)
MFSRVCDCRRLICRRPTIKNQKQNKKNKFDEFTNLKPKQITKDNSKKTDQKETGQVSTVLAVENSTQRPQPRQPQTSTTTITNTTTTIPLHKR